MSRLILRDNRRAAKADKKKADAEQKANIKERVKKLRAEGRVKVKAAGKVTPAEKKARKEEAEWTKFAIARENGV
jgi:hypothetical protein